MRKANTILVLQLIFWCLGFAFMVSHGYWLSLMFLVLIFIRWKAQLKLK